LYNSSASGEAGEWLIFNVYYIEESFAVSVNGNFFYYPKLINSVNLPLD